MRRHTTQIEGKICAVLAGSMHFVGQWVRLHMAITLLDVLDHIAQHHRCEFVPEAQREDVNVIAIEHIRWRLQSSKHVSESAGGWFFSIGPSVLIGLFFFKGGNFRPRLVRVLLVYIITLATRNYVRNILWWSWGWGIDVSPKIFLWRYSCFNYKAPSPVISRAHVTPLVELPANPSYLFIFGDL